MSAPHASGSNLQQSGASADSQFPDSAAGANTQQCAKKSWIAIELVDEEGHPVAGEAYVIEAPGGRKIEGVTDKNGCGGAQDIDPGPCKITFPNLDGSSWKPL